MMTMNDLTHDPARALTTDPTSATAGARAVDAHDSALTISRRYFLAVAAVAVGVTMVSGASTASLASEPAAGSALANGKVSTPTPTFAGDGDTDAARNGVVAALAERKTLHGLSEQDDFDPERASPTRLSIASSARR